VYLGAVDRYNKFLHLENFKQALVVYESLTILYVVLLRVARRVVFFDHMVGVRVLGERVLRVLGVLGVEYSKYSGLLSHF
jgi:hypothetical protein